jgi:hypothetical protein
MRVTVIYDDHYISVDGQGIHFVDNWPFDEENIHAIQWYADHGELEYKDTSPNLEFTDYPIIAKYISHFTKEKERIEEERRRIEEEERKRHEMWQLAMQELQKELNETKMNYENTIRNFEEVKTNLDIMSKSYMETQEQLSIANQVNYEIQKINEQISYVNPDTEIMNIIQPNVIDNIAEFSDGVDMSLFEDDESIIQQLEELQSLETERTEFDVKAFEENFDIDLLDEVNLANPQENDGEEDYILSIESLLDELDLEEETN